MMRLHLERQQLLPEATLGRLSIDGTFECFTLEDQVRDGPKVPGRTAIPFGHYAVAVTWSPRFQRQLPLLQGVKGFEGIRIHAGNTTADTEGCILVGCERSGATLRRSRDALDALFTKLLAAQRNGVAIGIDITR